MVGFIDWQDSKDGSYENMFKFTTATFKSGLNFNDDLGDRIQIATSELNTEAVNENISKGKPTGKYRMTFYAYPSGGSPSNSGDSYEFVFLNPSQTLAIESPQAESYNNSESVIAQWTEINGATEYFIKANRRTDSGQSLEEALNSGTPLIDNKSVGLNTYCDLRLLLSREWLPGDEIVFQVTTYVNAPLGGINLKSEILNFYIFDPTSHNFDNFIDKLEEYLSLFDIDDIQDKLKSWYGKQILEITLDGRRISNEEYINIMNYLSSNPNLLLNISVSEK